MKLLITCFTIILLNLIGSNSPVSQVLQLPTGNFDIFVGVDNYPSWTGFDLTQDYGNRGSVLIGIHPDRTLSDVFSIVSSYGGQSPELIDTKLSLKSDGSAFFKGSIETRRNLSFHRLVNELSPVGLDFVYDDGIKGTPDPQFGFFFNEADKLLLNRKTSSNQQFPVMAFLDYSGTGIVRVGIGTENPTQTLDVAGNIKSHELITGTSSLGNTNVTGNLNVSNVLTSINYINAGNYLSLNSEVSGSTLKIKTIGDENWGIEHSSQINLMSGTEFSGMGLRIMDNSSNGFYIRDKTSGNYRMVIRNGKIGIGTADPSYSLDVAGTLNAANILKNGQPITSSQWINNTNNIFFESGLVGIGTSNPNYSLDVAGTINATTILKNGQPLSTSQWLNNSNNIYFNSGSIGIGTNSPLLPLHVSTGLQIGTSSTANQNFHMVASNWDVWGLRLYSGSNPNGALIATFTNNGEVCIGTHKPFVNSGQNSKLSVNGTLTSKEVYVKANGWPDYVFSENYDLKPLEELELYIDKNSHLPEIPSVEDVEQNGIALGEMTSKLLQKVEELTLYIIEQRKEVERLKKEVSKLAK